MLSTPLVTEEGCQGAIKIYATTPGAFGPSDEHTLAKFADRAAVLVANARAYERASRFSAQFRDTLRDRDLITMAKGFLMGRDGLDEDAAFDRLLSLARAHDRSPAEAAADSRHAAGGVSRPCASCPRSSNSGCSPPVTPAVT